MARLPSASSLISVVLGCYPTLRELEMLDMSRRIFGDDKNKEYIYRTLQDCPLEVLGLKIAGGNRRAGVLDDILEVRHLDLARVVRIMMLRLASSLHSGYTENPTSSPGRRFD